MTKQRVVLTLVLCSLTALLAGQALSQTRSSNRSARASAAARRRRMTDAERRRKAAEMRRQRELKEKELEKEGRNPQIDRAQRIKELNERNAKNRKEFLYEKYALRASEEQWKVIKAKLEKVRHLRDQARSTVGMGLTSSSGSGTSSRGRTSRNVPTWQWKQPWKDKAPGEMTEAQKLAKQLIALVENNNTTPEQFRRKMDALRKARHEEDEIKRQLSEAQKELRELLTNRQEAALVLKNWL